MSLSGEQWGAFAFGFCLEAQSKYFHVIYSSVSSVCVCVLTFVSVSNCFWCTVHSMWGPFVFLLSTLCSCSVSPTLPIHSFLLLFTRLSSFSSFGLLFALFPLVVRIYLLLFFLSLSPSVGLYCINVFLKLWWPGLCRHPCLI